MHWYGYWRTEQVNGGCHLLELGGADVWAVGKPEVEEVPLPLEIGLGHRLAFVADQTNGTPDRGLAHATHLPQAWQSQEKLSEEVNEVDTGVPEVVRTRHRDCHRSQRSCQKKSMKLSQEFSEVV